MGCGPYMARVHSKCPLVLQVLRKAANGQNWGGGGMFYCQLGKG